MNFSTFRFTLDLHKHYSQMSIAAFQYDTAIKLIIGITDGGIPYHLEDGCLAILYGEKENGADPIVHSCMIEDNSRIIYQFNEATANVTGVVNCQIRIYKGDNLVLSCPEFMIVVGKRNVNDDIVMDDIEVKFPDQYSALNELINFKKDVKDALELKSDDGHVHDSYEITDFYERVHGEYTKGLEYTLNDDGISYTVSGIGEATDTDIVIPSEYNKLPVTKIKNAAFMDNISLTSVVIPDSVTTIHRYAFSGCTNLISITIPNSVTTIDDGVFHTCQSLKSVIIPDSVTTIDSSVFSYCKSLTSVTIPNSVTTIGTHAFAYCDSLTSVIIPDSVTAIGDTAFHQCTSLKSAAIGNGVTSIGYSAFNYCPSLTSVTLGNSVTTIGDNAFRHCKSLTSVTVPDSVTTIGKEAFFGCYALKTISVPKSVSTIGYYSFKSDSQLTVYCEAVSKPSGWDAEWNPDNCPVVWGAKLDFPSVTDALNAANRAIETAKNEAKSYTDTAKSEANSYTDTAKSEAKAYTDTAKAGAISEAKRYTDTAKAEAISEAKTYTNAVKNDLLGGAGEAYDTLKELADGITVNKDVIAVLKETAAGKAPKVHTHVVSDITNFDTAVDERIDKKSEYTVGLEYELNADGKSYAVKGIGTATDTDIVIPRKYNGLPVTTIGSSAFYICESLTSVILPDSVTNIGYAAFMYCNSLVRITIPNSVTRINIYAFYGCTNLSQIVIPKTVTSVLSDAFYNCNNLTIYCEAESKPSGWDADWNDTNCPVVWGVKIDFPSVTKVISKNNSDIDERVKKIEAKIDSPGHLTISQTMGADDKAVMSQKATTESIKNATEYGELKERDITDTLTIEDGYFYSNGLKKISQSGMCCTTLIPVLEGDFFKITTRYGYVTPIVVEFDETQTPISYKETYSGGNITATNYEYTVPSGIAYIVINNRDIKNYPLVVKKQMRNIVKDTVIENVESIAELSKMMITAENGIANGNFASVEGWTVTGGTLAVENNIVKVTATGTNAKVGVAASFGGFSSGDKVFFKTRTKVPWGRGGSVTQNEVILQIYVNTATGLKSAVRTKANIEWTDYYGTIEFDNTGTNKAEFLAQYNNTAYIPNNAVVEFRDIIAVNLTKAFGAGNEPTAEEFYSLLDGFDNKYFDGKTNLFRGDANFKRIYNNFKSTTLTKDITVTVGNGGDFLTLNKAIEYLSTFYPVYKKGGIKAYIKILAGTVINEQIFANQIDLQYITIIAEGNEETIVIDGTSYTMNIVDVDATGFGNTANAHDARGNFPFIAGENAAKLPTIGCVFRLLSETVESGRSICGMLCNRGSEGVVLAASGFDGFNDGCIANNESSITIREGISRNMTRWGVHARHNGEVSARSCVCTNCGVGACADRVADLDVREAVLNGSAVAIECNNISRANANGCHVQNCGTSSGYVVMVSGGGIVNCGSLDTANAVGSLYQITTNTLTPNGIIFI